MALLLAGCADVRLPSIVFDDGPAPGKAPAANVAGADAVLTGERPIRRADPEGTGFPSLASVPPRPTEFSSPVERQALLDRLAGERDEAKAVADALRAGPSGTAPVQPAGTAEPAVPKGPPPVPKPVPR